MLLQGVAVPAPASTRSSASGAALADVYASLRRGVSEAGSSVARVVSAGVSRLSSSGSGYVRIADDVVLNTSYVGRTGSGGGSSSWDGSTVPSVNPVHVSRAGMPQPSRLAQDVTQVTSDGVAGVLPTAWDDGNVLMPLAQHKQRSRASLNSSGGGAAACADNEEQATAATVPTVPELPRLARIRTPRPERPLSGDDDGNRGGSGGAGGSSSSDSGPVPGVGTGTGWRTRAQYQAALELASSSPVASPQLLAQARGRRSPSEPGHATHAAAVRGRAGLVSTPLSGRDATNRCAHVYQQLHTCLLCEIALPPLLSLCLFCTSAFTLHILTLPSALLICSHT